MKKLYFITVVLSLLISLSCKKSKEEKNVKVGLNNVAESIGSTLTNLATFTNGANIETDRQVLVAANAISKAMKSDTSEEIAMEIDSAGNFLVQLHDEGKLPGISKDEHGNITSDSVEMMISNKLIEVSFPMEWTFRMIKNGDTSTNNYTVVKQSKDGKWELQKAWLTDSNGQIIQEWPVK